MKIIKKKKGNKEYFYLKHSIRKGKKIITKEVYLGKKIPDNFYEIKEQLEHEEKRDLYKKFEKIKDNFQKEWKKYPKTVKDRELKEIAIAFTYNTNAIEGSTITLEETREIVKDNIAPNKPLSDIKETENHSKVFLEMLNKKEIISNNLMLEWHEKIFGETKRDISGKYREYGVRVGYYIAPDWQDVKKFMNGLIKFINNSKLNPVEVSARAHYRFERIHPFGDGNGRIGRLLMNYILWHNKYPMLIIEYKKRSSYYKALDNEEKFVNYYFRRYLAFHKKRL